MKKITLLLLVLAGLASCQQQKSSARANNTVANPFSAANIVLNGICTQGQSNMGAIYDSTNPYNFESRVKALLSATMSPNDVGTIGGTLNDTTGVRFMGTIKLDASGNVVQASSKITITVYDSIWYNNKMTTGNDDQAIPLEFDPAKGAQISGQFNPTTGQGFVLLKDAYGQIRFDGNYNSQYFSGTVSFVNTASVIGASPASGTLGQFQINSCGIIQK